MTTKSRAAPALSMRMQSMSKKPDLSNRLPVRDDVVYVTYHRPPTEGEIRFGHGATHYRDFVVSEASWPGTRILKKWFVDPCDGLRYYR